MIPVAGAAGLIHHSEVGWVGVHAGMGRFPVRRRAVSLVAEGAVEVHLRVGRLDDDRGTGAAANALTTKAASCTMVPATMTLI